MCKVAAATNQHLLLRSAGRIKIESDPEAVIALIHSFLAEARAPVLVEPGEDAVALEQGRYAIEPHPAGCVLQAWGDSGSWTRRVVGVRRQGRRLVLRVRRFAASETEVILLDRARESPGVERRASRGHASKSFGRMLERTFPGWKLRGLTAAPDLRRTLSPDHPRAFLTRGRHARAAVYAPGEADRDAVDRSLTTGLLWLDALRRERSDLVFEGLHLFAPRGWTGSLARRLRWMSPEQGRFGLWEFDSRGNAAPVSLDDAGNLLAELPPLLSLPDMEEPVARCVDSLLAIEGVEAVPRQDGLLSLRVRGLEFARAGRSVITAGLDGEHGAPGAGCAEALRLGAELAKLRNLDAASPENQLFARSPERWLESQVRRRLETIDPGLMPEPVYSQAPALAGRDRGILDLLACGHDHRLVVIELKVEEDPQLPLQALDYWIAVWESLRQGDYALRGYFPGIELAPRPPRLVLAAPALAFHPATEILLGFFSGRIPILRVGLNSDWRTRIQPVFRHEGASRLA